MFQNFLNLRHGNCGSIVIFFQFCDVITQAIIHKKNYMKSGNNGTFCTNSLCQSHFEFFFAKLRKFAQNKIDNWTPFLLILKITFLHHGCYTWVSLMIYIWLNSVNWWISFFHGGSWEDGVGYMLVFIYLEP